MSTSKHINTICIVAISLTLVLTILFMCRESLGIMVMPKTVKYESTLFDTSYVHQIDIVMDNWDAFIETCENEEYSPCTVVIDGNAYKNIAIRAKGNTSLSSVKSMGSQRYSLKLEFDHYEAGKNCDGLDKLCLNNLIQDNTMMKDYIVYQMMNDFGVDSPLCSYAYITVNGEDWGLYLAVEGVEESFLTRNYGSASGELYKPDSLSFGGGRGNGKDFNMDDFDFDGENFNRSGSDFDGERFSRDGSDFDGERFSDQNKNSTDSKQPGGGMSQMPDMNGMPDMSQMPDMNGMPDMSQMPGGEDFDINQIFDGEDFDFSQIGGGFGGGMGSDDVKLKYIDDDPNSYANIFDNAKTDVTTADKKRLISSLKTLFEYSNLEEILDLEEVLRYFVVHNFVCNEDSYTGSMIHNYYLYEEDGKLSMIPWDYNLAFGTFQGGTASSSVNESIDNPVSGGSVDDRPMVGWIFSGEEYTEQYHDLFSAFIEKWFANGELVSMIEDTAEMLKPYVEKDPTKFCTTEEFDKGVNALIEFVEFRKEAVSRQLAGDSTNVDTGNLDLSEMGSMSNGGFGGGGNEFPGGGNMPPTDEMPKGQGMPQDGKPGADAEDPVMPTITSKGGNDTVPPSDMPNRENEKKKENFYPPNGN